MYQTMYTNTQVTEPHVFIWLKETRCNTYYKLLLGTYLIKWMKKLLIEYEIN